MAFSDSWDETSPNGAVVAADTLDTIVKNEVKRAIRERMESLLGIADFSTRDPISADALRMNGAANSYIIGGTTSWGVKDKTGATYNFQLTDAGAATIRNGLTVTAGGAIITAGGLTVTAGGATITAGGFVVSAGLTSLKHLDVSQQGRFVEKDAGNSGVAIAIDWDNGNNQLITLTGNAAITFTHPTAGCWYQLRLVQDVVGSRIPTWPANVKWMGGVTPTFTTTASRTDIVSLYYNGTNYLGAVVGLNWNG